MNIKVANSDDLEAAVSRNRTMQVAEVAAAEFYTEEHVAVVDSLVEDGGCGAEGSG